MKKILFLSFVLFIFLVGCSPKQQTSQIQLNQEDAYLVKTINSETAKENSLSETGVLTDKVKSPIKDQEAPVLLSETEITTFTIPAELNLKVDFASQAPSGDWGLPYQEACEEASMIMAVKYLKNEPLNKTVMQEEILQLVKWEEDYFGYYKDTDVDEMLIMLDKYFGLKARKITDPSVDVLKSILASGSLILVPAAGRQLYNPYYSGEGPLYHVVLLRGYDDRNFITNDVGTKRGEGYKYKYQILMNAMHDWNGGDVSNGEKAVIVVNK